MYSISLNLRINWISCPGVWLCAKGYVVVKLTTLGGSRWSKQIYPKFPIFVDELFTFERVIFGGIDSLMAALEREQVCIELIQWMSSRVQVGVTLATFSRRLSHFFDRLVFRGSDVLTTARLPRTLMNKTEYFPDQVHHQLRQRSVCHSNEFVPHRHHWASGYCNPHWTILNEKFNDSKENDVILANRNEIKHPFCSWCYDTNLNLRCACCSCQQYHLTFH